MFLILGLTWAMDIIAGLLQPYAQQSMANKIFSCISNVINSLQGAILFGVMFFNSTNLKRIRQLIGKPRNNINIGMPKSSSATNTSNLTYNTNVAHQSNRIQASENTRLFGAK